ncbi:MAG: DUF421 domain-containing protein [Ramlibacter sp.]|nr:YetF domain-containing protein [Ramlibacter sp.]
MPDLSHLFSITTHPLELVVRGTAMYWFLFLLFRFVLRRDMGSIGVADVLLVVVIADASQNALAGSYQSITEGCILVATIAGWNWLLDFASYRVPALRKVLEAKPLILVLDGKMVRRNLRAEMITTDELMAKLREEGVERLEDVRKATMESDGEISVIRKNA